MPQDKGRTFVTQSISFPPELLASAKQRAERLGLPFSTYVQKQVTEFQPGVKASGAKLN